MREPASGRREQLPPASLEAAREASWQVRPDAEDSDSERIYDRSQLALNALFFM